MAADLGLTTITAPDGEELVIFNLDHLDRGWLWIKKYRLVMARDWDAETADTDPTGALGMLGRLSGRTNEPRERNGS